jgi:hypothetical protein
MLDLEESNSSEAICLCEGKDLPRGTKYITLSHCWGSYAIVTLEKGTLITFKSMIPLSDLPQTFRDAVVMTKRLGVRYLWIDSLCIIQDSAEDWQRESARMWEIYTYSSLNLAATGSSDGTGGLFRVRDPLSAKLLKAKATWTGLQPGDYYCLDYFDWNREMDESPLIARAWVMQERLLAPRVLHFGRDQLYWECAVFDASETFPEGLPNTRRARFKNWELRKTSADPLYQSSPDFVLGNAWWQLVTVYTRASLTKDGDKLVAISGVAKQMQNRFAETNIYLAGLWKTNLVYQLPWSTSATEFGARPETYRAPSWSWASVDGVISSPHILSSYRTQVLAQVLEAYTIPVADPMGQVRSGSIRLRGRLCRAALKMKGPLPLEISLYSLDKTTYLGGASLDTDAGWLGAGTEREVHCMPMFQERTSHGREMNGVLIEPTNFKRGQFRRIGSFRLLQDSCSRFDELAFNAASLEHYEEFDGVDQSVISLT